MSDSAYGASSELKRLKLKVREFVGERDWEQFHSPKNLAMAVSVEVAELVEIFQWLTQAQSQNLSKESHLAVEEEMADVLIYLLRLSDRLNIDLGSAVERKLAVNRKKYPADLVRGEAKKYTEYRV